MCDLCHTERRTFAVTVYSEKAENGLGLPMLPQWVAVVPAKDARFAAPSEPARELAMQPFPAIRTAYGAEPDPG